MKKVVLSSVALMLLFLFSCTHGNFDGYKLGDNNVRYKVLERSGDTIKPRFNDYVTVKMRYYTKDTLLFDSKMLDGDFVFPIIKPMFQGDIYDGMKLMAQGDSFSFAVVADSFYYKTANMKKLPAFITPGEAIYFDIKMEKVQTVEQYQKAENEKLQKEKQKQLDSLDKYLKENNITTKPLESGLIYTTMIKGHGSKPKPGDMCDVQMSVKGVGLRYELYNNFKDNPIFIEYGKPFDTKGLMEGLGLMREGEVALLIVPADIGVGKDGNNGTVPPFTTIIYEIKLNKIRTKDEVKKIRKEMAEKKKKEKEALRIAEPGKIKKYIEEHNVSVEPTASGLYFIPLKEGNGRHPEKGDTLSVHYTLYNIKGEKLFSTYDRKEPFMFVLGTGSVIPGWEEALPMMRKGGAAKLIIPSKLGYQDVEKKKYHIPAYSPLVEEVELVNIMPERK